MFDNAFIPIAASAIFGIAGTLIVQHVARHRTHKQLLYKRRLEVYPEIYWRYLNWTAEVYKIHVLRHPTVAEYQKADLEFHQYVADKLLIMSDDIFKFFQEYNSESFHEDLRALNKEDAWFKLLKDRSWLFNRMRKELGIGSFFKDLEAGGSFTKSLNADL